MTLDAQDIDAIVSGVSARVLSELRGSAAAAQAETKATAAFVLPPLGTLVDVERLKRDLLGENITTRTAHRRLSALGVKSVMRGLYRWHDVYNAIARKKAWVMRRQRRQEDNQTKRQEADSTLS